MDSDDKIGLCIFIVFMTLIIGSFISINVETIYKPHVNTTACCSCNT